MTDDGFYNESEMMQKTCKAVRVMRKSGDGMFVAGNRDTDATGSKAAMPEQIGMVAGWNNCEGSTCAHWRWHKRHFWSKVSPGGLGYCGLSGTP